MKTFEISLPKKVDDMLRQVLLELGHTSKAEFIADAVARRLLEVSKAKYEKLAKKIRISLKSKRMTVADMVADFERFREKNYRIWV